MITKDLQPFSIVEDVAFREFTHYLEPRYVFPSRKTFRDQVLPAQYAKIRETLKFYLSGVNHFSITSDAWTSRETTSYITHTVHLINKDFDMKAFQLGTYEVSESHTAAILSSHLLPTCQKWGIIPTRNLVLQLQMLKKMETISRFLIMITSLTLTALRRLMFQLLLTNSSLLTTLQTSLLLCVNRDCPTYGVLHTPST